MDYPAPGQVNLMTAGRGIVHSERSPQSERDGGAAMYGMQTWLALPDGKEEIAPAFEAVSDLPLLEDVIINAFEDCVTVEQVDPQTDEVMRLTLSLTQVRDLAAALNLPEGSYRLERKAV